MLALPEDRSGMPLRFRLPAWDSLFASAGRLLRFEFPPVRNPKVYERLIRSCSLPPSLSRKGLETMPLPEMEQIYRSLWQFRLGQESCVMDEWLTLFLLSEEMSEFRPEAMVWRDVEMLASRSPEGMHSYYYESGLTCRNMIAFLEGHGYRADFLSHQPDVKDEALWRAYLISRSLSRPLPWSALLDALGAEQAEKFPPALARLRAIRALLAEQGWTQTPVTPEHLSEALSRLELFAADSRISALSSQYGIPRPLRVRVIVEGETEKMLLPLFAKAKGLDFNRLGVSLLPAGGKNQVLTLYRENSHCLSAPICVILDADAGEVARELNAMLRPGDAVFPIEEGEFEDLYDPALIAQTANQHYQLYPELTVEAFRQWREAETGCVRTLKRIWLAHQLGDFDKIEFATRYATVFEQFSAEIPLPPAICRMLDGIVQACTTPP